MFNKSLYYFFLVKRIGAAFLASSHLLYCQPTHKKKNNDAVQLSLPPYPVSTQLSLQPRRLYLFKKYSDQEKAQLQKEISHVTAKLADLIALILNNQPQKLNDFIDQEHGVYIDLKAHWKASKVRKEIQSKKGYLYRSIFSKKEPDSVFHVLHLSSQIEVDYYLQAERHSYQLKLHLSESLNESYQLNNPVFSYKSGKWYLYRML